MEQNKDRKFDEEIAQLGNQKLIKLFFATGNKNKFREMQYLGRNGFEVNYNILLLSIFKISFSDVSISS